MRNIFKINEAEKNRIKKLHKNHSVIKEQAATPMGMVLQLCNNGGALTFDFHLTLNGQDLTQGDVGKEVAYAADNSTAGVIESIFPSTPGAPGPFDFIEQACPPFQMPPLGLVLQVCNNGGPLNLDFPITVGGVPIADLPQYGVGLELEFIGYDGTPLNGTVESIFVSSNPGMGPIDSTQTPCPPPTMPLFGVELGSCDPATLPTNLDMPVTINGVPLSPNDVGKEIEISNSNYIVNSVFVTTNQSATPIDFIEAPCPPPTMPDLGIMLGSCNPATLPTQVNFPVTLNGVPVTQNDVGKEVVSVGGGTPINGVIDSLIYTTNQGGPNVDFTEAPCPPPDPAQGPMGITFDYCDGVTTPTDLPVPITINGVPVTASDIGKEIVINQGSYSQVNGIISSMLQATQNLSQTFDIQEMPCPAAPVQKMGIELKLCGQPQTMPMSIDADVTIDGNPVTQGDVGKEVSAGQPNMHGTVDSVFISTNPTTVSFVSKPCTTGPIDWKQMCEDEFMILGYDEQKDICKKCKQKPGYDPICKCCEFFKQ